MSYQILVVDDERSYFEMLEMAPVQDMKFSHISCPTLINDYLKANKVDLILMDWNLGTSDGVEETKKLKQFMPTMTIPVIMFSGKSDTNQMAFALEQGADDYVSKPFTINFLMAKINSNLRKYGSNLKPKQTYFNNVHLDENTFTISIKGETVQFRRKEFMIMKLLITQPERVFTREELNNLSEPDLFVSHRVVDTTVSYIREKIKNRDIIETVYGQGYKINKNIFI